MGKTKTAFVGEALEEKKEKKSKKEEPKKIHISGLKGGQRIKAIEAEPLAEEQATEEEKKAKKAKGPKVRSKRYKEAKSKVDTNQHSVKDALKLVKESSYTKFDGTVEMHLVVKKAGVSTKVTLPHSAGRQKVVEIASDETIEKLKGGKIDFDILLATADMMPKLVPFAKVLGPKGLMPNPKSGTLLSDIKKAKGFSAGSITLKTEKEAPLIHTVIGKVSQPETELVENAEEILKALGGTKQIVKAYLKATMGPSVKLAIA